MAAFLLPIFGNVDGSWRVTSKLRGSTLIQVARRRSKVFQRVSAILVRVGDVQGVSRRHAVRGKKTHQYGGFLGGVEKVEKFIEKVNYPYGLIMVPGQQIMASLNEIFSSTKLFQSFRAVPKIGRIFTTNFSKR